MAKDKNENKTKILSKEELAVEVKKLLELLKGKDSNLHVNLRKMVANIDTESGEVRLELTNLTHNEAMKMLYYYETNLVSALGVDALMKCEATVRERHHKVFFTMEEKALGIFGCNLQGNSPELIATLITWILDAEAEVNPEIARLMGREIAKDIPENAQTCTDEICKSCEHKDNCDIKDSVDSGNLTQVAPVNNTVH